MTSTEEGERWHGSSLYANSKVDELKKIQGYQKNKSLFSQDFHFSKPGVPFNWLHLVPSFCASGNQIMYLNLAVYSIYFIFSLK